MAKKKGTATATKPKREPKPKQAHLIGMEPPSVPEIDKAASAYCDVRDQRMEMTKVEVEKKTILLHVMQKHGFKVYDLPDGSGKQVVCTSKDNVRVRAKQDPDGELNEDADTDQDDDEE